MESPQFPGMSGDLLTHIKRETEDGAEETCGAGNLIEGLIPHPSSLMCKNEIKMEAGVKIASQDIQRNSVPFQSVDLERDTNRRIKEEVKLEPQERFWDSSPPPPPVDCKKEIKEDTEIEQQEHYRDPSPFSAGDWEEDVKGKIKEDIKIEQQEHYRQPSSCLPESSKEDTDGHIEQKAEIEIHENELNASPSTGRGDTLYCTKCSYHCLGQDVLKQHMKYKHGSTHRKYKCNYCEYSADIPSVLRKHQITHTGERPYACDKCDKTFTEKPHLVNHVSAVHMDLRPYSCDICGKAFKLGRHLARHKRTHSGGSVVRCELCGKGYSRHEHYVRHMKSHTRETLYKCRLCTSEFVRRDNLMTHMRHSH